MRSKFKFYRILGRAIEGLDSEVLFYPFEKHLDLPSTLIEICYCLRRQ